MGFFIGLNPSTNDGAYYGKGNDPISGMNKDVFPRFSFE